MDHICSLIVTLIITVVGLGFGMMSGAFSLVNVLADSIGPGTVGFEHEPQNFFMVSAATCLAMILCHTSWGVIAFAALDDKKYHLVGFVWVAHFLVSCLVSLICPDVHLHKHLRSSFVSFSLQTLLNQQMLYVATVIPAYIVMLTSAALAFVMAGGSFRKLKHCLTCPGVRAQTTAN